MTEIILHQLAQFELLDMAAGNALGWVGPAIRVYFRKRPLFKLCGGVGGLPLIENSEVGLRVP